MFLRADHVCNLEVVIVHHTGEVIQAGAVGPLNDVILLAIPSKLHPPSHGPRVLADGSPPIMGTPPGNGDAFLDEARLRVVG